MGCAGELKAQTSVVTSVIMGYSKISIPLGGRVVAPVFVKTADYAGNSTISGSTFSASGLTPNAFAPTAFTNRPNYPTCYVEITDANSAYQGQIYDIASNTSNGITVYGLPGALNGLANLAIAVRPHMTLGDLAAASAGLSSYSDAMTLYDTNNQQTSYYYTSTGVVGSNYSTPSGQTVICPGEGVILNTSGAATITWSGEVKTNKTVASINAGATILAPLDPCGGALLGTMNLASALAAYSDALSLVSTNGSFSITSFYSDGSSLLDQNYSPIVPSNTPPVVVGNGFIVNSVSGGAWTNQLSF